MPQESPICVHTEGLTYRYSDQSEPAVDEITLRILQGESVALMGPNGCGKSTLAKLLAGLIPPTSGGLRVLGSDLNTTPGRAAVRGRVGIVFQYPDEQMVATTVEREIAFGPENLGRPPEEIRRTVDALLERFDLTGYVNQSPHLLSGGEKQRLALAAVLALQPDFLVLDEVTSLLDPTGRRRVIDHIKSLRGETALLLITQFAEEALVADRLIIMDQGRIAADADPRELFFDARLMTRCQIEPPPAFGLLKAAGCAKFPPKN